MPTSSVSFVCQLFCRLDYAASINRCLLVRLVASAKLRRHAVSVAFATGHDCSDDWVPDANEISFSRFIFAFSPHRHCRTNATPSSPNTMQTRAQRAPRAPRPLTTGATAAPNPARAASLAVESREKAADQIHYPTTRPARVEKAAARAEKAAARAVKLIARHLRLPSLLVPVSVRESHLIFMSLTTRLMTWLG